MNKTIVMLFVTIPTKDLARYSYMSSKLREMLYNMRNARKNLEGVANASFDKAFAKCIYLLASESLQCENEIVSQIDSLDGQPKYDCKPEQKEQSIAPEKIMAMDSLCKYCEKVYIERYKQLINDKHLSSLKSLMTNHLQLFLSSLTQLRLFHDASAN
jgi:hypothetical protein